MNVKIEVTTNQLLVEVGNYIVRLEKYIVRLEAVAEAARAVANSNCVACGDEECNRDIACENIKKSLMDLDEVRQK